MKRNFTFLYFLLGATLISLGANAQTAGDFRTNGTGGGNWSALATWQTFNGATWVPAVATPTSTDGQIDILSGDVVLEDVAGLTVDQLIVDAGGTLTANQGGSPVLTMNLNDGAGDDLTVNGTFALGGNYTLTGAGSADVVVASGGTMNFTSGVLGAITTVNAGGIFNINLNVSGFDKHISANLTNNGVLNWGIDGVTDVGGLFLDGTTITNNGTINERFIFNHGFTDEAGTNSFINHGIFNKTTTWGFFNQGVPVNSDGTFNGSGTLNFTGVGVVIVDGIMIPGAINGATTSTLGFTTVTGSSQAVNYKSIIGSPGAVAGTNFDQLQDIDAGALDLSAATLTVLDNGSGTDPVGTTYAVLTNGGGSFSGTFANVVLSPNLGNLTINAASVTVQKTGAQILPLNWGPFTAVADGDNVSLKWSTYQEENTSHFNVQWSTDGGHFTTIGTVTAAGNSNLTSSYSYTHTTPNLNGPNYYRLQEVDLDGKGGFSTIQAVRFNNGQIVKVQATPNPVHDLLQFSVQEKGLSAVLVDGAGRSVRTWILQPGTQQVSVTNLPTGMYSLVIYQHSQQIDVQHILKF